MLRFFCVLKLWRERERVWGGGEGGGEGGEEGKEAERETNREREGGRERERARARETDTAGTEAERKRKMKIRRGYRKGSLLCDVGRMSVGGRITKREARAETVGGAAVFCSRSFESTQGVFVLSV